MALLGVMADGYGYVVGLLPGVVITGFASGLGFPALAVAALVKADEGNAGLGSARLSPSQQLGGALGLAVFANVVTGSSETAPGSVDTLAEGIPSALVAIGAVLIIGAIIASRLPRHADTFA